MVVFYDLESEFYVHYPDSQSAINGLARKREHKEMLVVSVHGKGEEERKRPQVERSDKYKTWLFGLWQSERHRILYPFIFWMMLPLLRIETFELTVLATRKRDGIFWQRRRQFNNILKLQKIGKVFWCMLTCSTSPFHMWVYLWKYPLTAEDQINRLSLNE